MLQSTRGIVFKQLKYSETSLIVKIFTEHFGLQSYIVKGVRSRRSKTKPALFQPLNLLELVVYHKEGKTLHHLSEVKIAYPFQSIPVDIRKRSLLFFLSELLHRSIREETPDTALFEWLFNALTWLDLSDNNIVNFHLVFMIQLSRFLGFYPKRSTSFKNDIFDLQEGQFSAKLPDHPNFLKDKPAIIFEKLIDSSFESGAGIAISNNNRRYLLEKLVTYYSLHLPGFGEMKSMEVLKSVLE